MNAPILTIRNLSTGYASRHGAKAVAEHLTATLSPGSFTALIGVNGSGKSTLLRTLAGLQPALAGEICWQGKSLPDYSRRELARTLAVVLTDRVVGDGLTVCDVVEMGRMPYTGFDGRLSPEDHEVVKCALRLTGIETMSDRMVSSLSDGERQRVMIAKALAQQTPVILLDEPTAFLDFPSKAALLKLLKSLAIHQGKTIIVSTHDLELTFQIAEHLWLLSSDGLFEGSPAVLAEDGSLERFFHSDGLRFDKKQLRFILV